ncbi:MAG: RluA family pseudouridine synthase [Lautropia sp.]|nr:RluA family pseudouridine synthase [Lautropia sp.]
MKDADTKLPAGTATPPQRLMVDVGHEGQRLDNYLLAVLRGVPKTRIYRMIRTGEVRIDGRRARAEQRVALGQQIRVPPLMNMPATALRHGAAQGGARLDERHIRILFEDEHLLVVDKSEGLAVHGGSGIAAGLIERLRTTRSPGQFLELAHRLDRDTSGVLVIAKRRSTLLALHRMFAQGAVRKHYLAMVKGHWGRPGATLVQLPLLRFLTPAGERRVRVDARGQAAATRLKRLQTLDFAATPGLPPHGALMACELLTGRTHQIRVHLAQHGHPILGDEKYGDFTLNKSLDEMGYKRMFLHAFRMEMTHPKTGEILRLEAPLPATFQTLIERFGEPLGITWEAWANR